MSIHRREFETLRPVLVAAEEPLTAREILDNLETDGGPVGFDNAHRVATVLGRRADRGDVEVVGETPYRYRLSTRAARRFEFRSSSVDLPPFRRAYYDVWARRA